MRLKMKDFVPQFLGAFLFLCFILFSFGHAEKISYSGYKIVRIYHENTEQRKGLALEMRKLEKMGASIVFENRESTNLLYPPHLESLIEEMKKGGFKMEIAIDDVQQVIDSQQVNQDQIVNGSLEWDRYYPLADIYQFIEDQAAIHSSIASVQSIGNSYDGREMKIIKISKSGETKPAIWIDSNIHGREWITSAVCTYIIDQLLNSNDTVIQSWLDEYDIYVLPVWNVDGFEFSHIFDRFWRKSRSIRPGSPCFGTDLNRNFDWHWLENGGASPDPCISDFAGIAPFSEVESANVRDFLSSISSRLVFYLSLHSAGQFFLFPTGLNDVRIPNYQTYMRIGNLTAEAHKQRFGTIFTPGSIYDEMYVATGTTQDWVWDTLKTNLTITYELRDRGEFGPLLPPDQIYPSALEFMDGLKVLMSELSKGIPEVDP